MANPSSPRGRQVVGYFTEHDLANSSHERPTHLCWWSSCGGSQANVLESIVIHLLLKLSQKAQGSTFFFLGSFVDVTRVCQRVDDIRHQDG